MDHAREHVEGTIVSRRLFRRGESILIAVSGGVDSMALLHLLHDLAPRHGWKLTVAHFNHQLRGRSSQADERLVRRVAANLGLRVIVGREDARRRARRRKCSLEMAARESRHAFLARMALRTGAKVIAVAHHADDQAELFFLRLFRGSGGDGLSGMKWRSPSPANPNVNLARPLLDLPKAALVEYARANRIDYREDATNASLQIRRNRVRHELLPFLKRNYQPSIEKTILRVMDLLGADAEFVDTAARNWLALRGAGGPGFEALAVALQRAVVKRQLIRSGIRPDYDLIEKLRLFPNQPLPVSSCPNQAPDLFEGRLEVVPGRRLPAQTAKTVQVWRDALGSLRLRRTAATASQPQAPALRLDLERGKPEAVFGGVRFSWRIKTEKRRIEIIRSVSNRELFDADKVGRRITLRHWRPGDRIQPIGMTQTVKLQDLFVNLKIPRERRRQLVIGVSEKGEVFWVEGLRISERFKLTRETRRYLLWRWERP
jgi:tRNA(Ile)-lysidine synthase